MTGRDYLQQVAEKVHAVVDANVKCTKAKIVFQLNKRVFCAVRGQAQGLADGCDNGPQTTMIPLQHLPSILLAFAFSCA